VKDKKEWQNWPAHTLINDSQWPRSKRGKHTGGKSLRQEEQGFSFFQQEGKERRGGKEICRHMGKDVKIM